VSVDSLMASLSQRVDDSLKPLLEGQRQCALLDFPNHANVGDSAIWLAQERYVRRAGLRVVYRCDANSYSERRLASTIGQGVILLTGGGNLGDLYAVNQELRERVIRRFSQNTIIQLPQSISFRSRENLDRARTIFNAHPALTLLLRDAGSLDLARNEFRAPSILCPDIAFTLGPFKRRAAAVVPIFWLARSDNESKHAELAEMGAGVERQDWMGEAPGPIGKLDRMLGRVAARFQGKAVLLDQFMSSNVYGPWFRRLASERVEAGLRRLSRGRVVITDRLHAFILSLLMGVPHVVLDNSYGKLQAFHNTWTVKSPITHWANSPREALQRARALAG
jgi:exopolysaccharide biosynthesis predicted pyruvyltransferase EpsI